MEEKLGFVPERLMEKVERLVEWDLERNILPLPEAIKLVEFLLTGRKEREKNEVRLIECLNRSI
jgi:hypothetical protein